MSLARKPERSRIRKFSYVVLVALVSACSQQDDLQSPPQRPEPSRVNPSPAPILVDYDTQLQQLWIRAKQDDTEAQITLGHLLLTRLNNSNENSAETNQVRKWLETAASAGHGRAKVILARGNDAALENLALSGEGSAYAEMARYCQKGRARGGFHFDSKGSKSPCEAQGACALWHAGAKLGDAESQFEHAFCAKDDRLKSHQWLEKAVAQGYSPAYFELGKLLLDKSYQNYDVVEGVRLFREGANKNCLDCALYLAFILWEGRATTQNFAEAVKWWQEAADLKSGAAMFGLAVAYAEGKGVTKDLSLSYVWSNLAVFHSQDEDEIRRRATQYRNAISQKLTPEELVLAQEISSKWIPRSISIRAPLEIEDPINGRKSVDSKQTSQPIGTAFFVNREGYLITAHHVAASCNTIRVGVNGALAKVVSSDRINDVALLKADLAPQSIAEFRDADNLKQGEDVVVYGYPLAGVLSTEGVVSAGTVSALQGLENNSSQIQLDAPVQPGNSGGPVIDRKGAVVGVIISKLDALRVAKSIGDVPQNVNFAVKSRAVMDLLKSNRVEFTTAGFSRLFSRDNQKITADARGYVVRVDCDKVTQVLKQ
jgi:S1-C subfamily serine protease